MKYEQIGYGDMVRIESYLYLGMKASQIAIKLSRNKSTIGRLIKKNVDEDGVFRADNAWEKVRERNQWKLGRNKILDNELLESYILEKIEKYGIQHMKMIVELSTLLLVSIYDPIDRLEAHTVTSFKLHSTRKLIWTSLIPQFIQNCLQ